jgi:hypothetical protein
LNRCKRFWGVLTKQNWMAYFKHSCGRFKNEAEAIKNRSDDK